LYLVGIKTSGGFGKKCQKCRLLNIVRIRTVTNLQVNLSKKGYVSVPDVNPGQAWALSRGGSRNHSTEYSFYFLQKKYLFTRKTSERNLKYESTTRDTSGYP
jgi:phage FluMu protein Com